MGGASELEALSAITLVVPDSVLMASEKDIPRKAATVSAGVLGGILNNPAGLQEYKTAIERARVYDKCAMATGEARLACQLDKALVNVGSLFLERVEGDGRVSTEVDPRLAYNTEALLKRSRNIVAEYAVLGVPLNRFLLRIPATWEGIQAAKQLEAEGVATHLVLVYSFVQAAAAAQAGVSVIQPNVGRIGDYYIKNPGAIRDHKGPREDSGFGSRTNPGIALVERIYSYVERYYSGSAVMATGIRHKSEALQLAGIHYMTVSPTVWDQLQESPTLQGYNDGLSAGSGLDDGLERRLSPKAAAETLFSKRELETVTAESFAADLGELGLQLLHQGLKGLQESADRLEPTLSGLAIDAE